MKNRSLFFVVVAAFFLCGCNQNLQTIAMTTPALTAEPTTTMELSPTVTLIPTPAPIPTPTSMPTPTLTFEPTPTLTLTPTPEPISTGVFKQAPEPFEGDFWCELYAEDTKLRMSLSEVFALNEQNFRTDGTSLVKLSEAEQINVAQIREMIESYSFPKMKYYGNEVLSEQTKEKILKQRNLDALQNDEDVELTFGILIQNADLRSFPAERPLTAEKNGRYDYFQETVLYLNEAVVVLHSSADGAWCFVQGENYFGWIREELIAYCEKEEMQKQYKALFTTENKNILVVTENVEYKPEDNVRYPLRMGTKLFLKTKDNGEEYVIVPVRDGDKQLQTKEYPVSLKEKNETVFHRGYLSYTASNVVTLATELLDTPYAWGDSLPYGDSFSYETEIGMDCSSTVVAVYRCFGFVLPRNTGAQRGSAWDGVTVSAYTIEQKKEVLDSLPTGALLYSPGHVMFYLGAYEGEYYVLHNTTTEFLSDGTEKSYNRCVISPLSLGKKGETILEQLLEIKVPDN